MRAAFQSNRHDPRILAYLFPAVLYKHDFAVLYTAAGARKNSVAGLYCVFHFGHHCAAAALSVRIGRVVSAWTRVAFRSIMLGVQRMAHRLGYADQRYAEFHNGRFLGLVPWNISQVFDRRYFVTLRLWLVATDHLSVPRWATIGAATDQQPERSGRNMVPAVHRHPAARRQNTFKAIHVVKSWWLWPKQIFRKESDV